MQTLRAVVAGYSVFAPRPMASPFFDGVPLKAAIINRATESPDLLAQYTLKRRAVNGYMALYAGTGKFRCFCVFGAFEQVCCITCINNAEKREGRFY